MEIEERIKKAKESFRKAYQTSFRKMAEFSVHLMKTELKGSTYKKFTSVDLTRAANAIDGGMADRRKNAVLKMLEYMLERYAGIEFDEAEKEYRENSALAWERTDFFEDSNKGNGGNMMEAGLESVHAKMKLEQLLQQLEDAEEITIQQTILPNAIDFISVFERAVKKNLKRLRILLIYPYSEPAKLRGAAIGHSHNSFDRLITSSLRSLVRMYNNHPDFTKVIEVRFYNKLPSFSFYGYKNSDGVEHFNVGFYWNHKTTINGTFLTGRDDQEDNFFAGDLKEHFETLWEESKENRVPLEPEYFEEHIEKIEKKHKVNRLKSNHKYSDRNYNYKCFYYRSNKWKDFSLEVDRKNRTVLIEKKSSSQSTYEGIYQESSGNSGSLIAQEKNSNRPRILSLLIHHGAKDFFSKPFAVGLYTNSSYQFSTPYSEVVILVKLKAEDVYQAVDLPKGDLTDLIKDKNLNLDDQLIKNIAKGLRDLP